MSRPSAFQPTSCCPNFVAYHQLHPLIFVAQTLGTPAAGLAVARHLEASHLSADHQILGVGRKVPAAYLVAEDRLGDAEEDRQTLLAQAEIRAQSLEARRNRLVMVEGALVGRREVQPGGLKV